MNNKIIIAGIIFLLFAGVVFLSKKNQTSKENNQTAQKIVEKAEQAVSNTSKYYYSS